MTSHYVVIKSRENQTAKSLIALAHSARERKKTSLTVLDGAHLVEAFLGTTAPLEYLVLAESAIGSRDATKMLGIVGERKIVCHVLADALIAEASQLESPASMMAVVRTPSSQPIPVDADAVLVLDNVQDPGNVGAMLRGAAAFGIAHTLLGVGTAFAWSPKVLRSAQGAHFQLNIVEGASVASFMQSFRGQTLALVAAADGAIRLQDHNLRRPTAILVGNEGAGLAEEIIARATHRLTIPMPGNMESLNAASSGVIAMYEMCRQRQR